MERQKKFGKSPEKSLSKPSKSKEKLCPWCEKPLLLPTARVCQLCAATERDPGRWKALTMTEEESEEIEVYEADDEWDALHQAKNRKGIQIVKLEEIKNPVVEIKVLSSMCSEVWKLKVSKPIGKYGESLKGIDFHVVLFIAKSNSCKFVLHKEVTHKDGSGVCFENSIFPLSKYDLSGGHLLIRQTKCPCTRCRTAFSAWAHNLNCVILVAFDDGYDDIKANSILIFLPTGDIYYRS